MIGSKVLTDSPIIAITPFENPDVELCAAACRAGALGILDIGRDRRRALRALQQIRKRSRGRFGVRIPMGVEPLPPGELTGLAAVVVEAGTDLAAIARVPVLVQVTSIQEAREAMASGAAGLIAKGSEAGGRIGDESAFVLIQRLAGAVDLPLWVEGGIGEHTAAACLAGGAVGVVLNEQLALCTESRLPPAIKSAIEAMDGSETTVLAGHRIYTRPDLPAATLSPRTPEDVVGRLGARSLATDLLPMGQAGSQARPLAERHQTVGGIVRAMREAMVGHLRQARGLAPLGPASPLARDHGLRYPIAQGPMTRVSDRASFAEAVTDAGGLPFLALSVMGKNRVRALLEETAGRLGDKPWGVGILGFVPPQLREEQLEVIREFRPPVALIAGGRPSQARPLEAQGIATYLHVPSPGLLDLFLRDGARRFVFEGRECGGHVGPRSSFALWEAQIARLLQFEAPSQLSVLFAGGIHDARSAAMVAAMAAPLAARGVRIGVLMGTAYLFTEEAVASGAIKPTYQQAAIECDNTVLLETAPGHATRCVESEYVRSFRAHKAQLESDGISGQDMWATLEQLNLGRLRLASKALRRDGPELVAVDEGTQLREGMFMIGQVASLRRRTCTVRELHEQVSIGGTRLLAEIDLPEASEEPSRPADIAIVGIACIFPGADDLDAFWSNIVEGRNSITEVPKSRWDPDLYYDPKAMGGEKSNSKWGGFIDPVLFDPLQYGIPPRSLAAIEPVQLLSLEVARRALLDAGYTPGRFDGEQTSVIFGAEAGTDLAGGYGFRALFPKYVGELPEALDEALPKLTEDSFPGVLANVIAGRIANRLDLGGVNYTVDAACASAFAAVDLAVKELTLGTSDMVVCGGADLHNSINDYLMFSSVHALSKTGQCRTFDHAADGIVIGEGIGALVLKRLEDAERDGDRIYAVIKAVAGSSDGRSLGLTAPRKEGQVRALRRTYARAGVSPRSVGLVEAHGTGTVVGDRTELATLTEVFGNAGVRPASCTLGSVKSQIGHTKCAAGVAGLIKVAMALHHRVLPPTLNIERPNPFYDPDSSPFVLDNQARPWTGQQRRGAVSAFGFGGTNFHAVLEEYEADGSAAGHRTWPAEVFLFRGADRSKAVGLVQRLLGLLEEPASHRLRDLAWSVCTTGTGPVQIAIVATSIEDLQAKLDAARVGGEVADGVYARREVSGKIAFLFPGQGSQRPAMMRELFVAFPDLHRHLEAGASWAPMLFPPTPFTTRGAHRPAPGHHRHPCRPADPRHRRSGDRGRAHAAGHRGRDDGRAQLW